MKKIMMTLAFAPGLLAVPFGALAETLKARGAVCEAVEIRGRRSPMRRRLRDHAARSMGVAESGSASVSQPSTLRMTI